MPKSSIDAAHSRSGEALDRLRAICLALPEADERISHGAPCWFIKKGKQFASYVGCLHGDSRSAFWLAAPPGAQEALIQAEPERFFRPPYVGGAGWIGVFADVELDWEEIKGLAEEAWLAVCPPTLRSQLAV